MWGNDYPHPEGTWPHSQDVADGQFADLSDDELAAVVGGNAAKVFGFDLPATT
jgi:predicted TIM-barrel fold metal-dependent hydrolase